MRGAQNPLKGILSKGGHPTICLCVCKTSNLAITLRHLGVFQIFFDHRKGKIEANPNLRPECHNSQNRPPKNTIYWRTTFLADRSRTDKVHFFSKILPHPPRFRTFPRSFSRCPELLPKRYKKCSSQLKCN